MKRHPSHLGGVKPPTPAALPPAVRAMVRAHRQDDRTRRWWLEVELRGGRQLRNVAMTGEGFSATGGRRPRLPGVGTWGLVVFTEPGYGTDAYWLAAIDLEEHGVDQDTAGEALDLHASGYGTAVTEDGTSTVRWPNGDILFQGAGLPYEFTLRDPAFSESRRLHRLNDLNVRNNYVLDARKGGALWAVLLVGGLKVMADAAKRRIELTVDENNSLVVEPGGVSVTTPLMRVGMDPDSTVPVALWPETQMTLAALAGELRAVKHRQVMLEARVNRNQEILRLVVTLLTPWFLPLFGIPPIPLPFFTKSDKTGGLVPSAGGVQVVDAASESVYGS